MAVTACYHRLALEFRSFEVFYQMATVFKLSRKRKRSMWDQAEQMRQVKFSTLDAVHVASSSDTSDTSDTRPSSRESSHCSINLDESLQLPGPSAVQEESNSSTASSESDTSEDLDVTADSFSEPSQIQSVYDDWMFSLDRDDRKTLAMMLYDIYSTLSDLTC